MSFNIEVEGGSSIRLPTAGKYCDRDIVITALGGGGGGSMETGELTTTSANHYRYTIPVSSKKTHLLIYPKSLDDIFSLDTTTRGRVLIAVDGGLFLQSNLGKMDTTSVSANSYWNNSGSTAAGTATFNNDSIAVTISYNPWAMGEYLWFAW